MPLIGLMLLLIFTALPLAKAEPTHVIVEERSALRRGPSAKQRIVQRLAKDTPVTLDEDSPAERGFTAIRLADGRRGWILTRQLSAIPPPPPPAPPTTTSCPEVGDALQLQQDNERLRLELAELRRASAQAAEFMARNSELETKTAALEQANRVLQQEKQILQDDSQYRWFLYGAGVLLGGCLLGIWLPGLQLSRRQRGWRDLA